MSCAAIASAALLWLAAGPQGMSPEPAPLAGAVAYEPLFADIMARAKGLKAEVEALGPSEPVPDALRARIRELADLDMQGHKLLAARQSDGDLKCILKGIAEDLPLKLQALDDAKETKARKAALSDMAYLLNDNVEVIAAPPAPAV
jgi:hypothetical protein